MKFFNRKRKILFVVLPVLLISNGCSLKLPMKMMSRDEGKIYSGTVNGNGFGSGTISINFENKTCEGSFARGASTDSFGFFQTYGGRSSTVGTVQSVGGTSTVKALLSCSDGTGLRCDFIGGGGTATGICVDSKKNIYDVIVG